MPFPAGGGGPGIPEKAKLDKLVKIVKSEVYLIRLEAAIMKRKIQGRQHKTSKVAKPPQGTRDQRRLQVPGAVRRQSESANYISASEAKNRFATVLDTVGKGEEVFITKHNAPKAVVISLERFMALSGAATSVLDRLTDEFDARLARMQTPAARSAMERAFHASSDELGKAALKAGRLPS